MRPRGLYPLADALAKFFHRSCAGQINRELLEASIGQVHVRVVESGHHKMAFEVDDRSRRPLQLQDVSLAAHRENAFSAHGQGLRPLNLMETKMIPVTPV